MSILRTLALMTFVSSAFAVSNAVLKSRDEDTSGDPTSEAAAAAKAKQHMIVQAHGSLASVTFVILYPLGAIAVRTLNFQGLVWVHAGWMLFTYVVFITGASLGIWLAVNEGCVDAYHAIIGIVVLGSLLLQPVTGLSHHLLYKRRGRPNAATYPHIYWGRIIITLGIINGGLGLQLSANTTAGIIAYSVIAGVIWLTWMGVVVSASVKSTSKPKGETSSSLQDSEKGISGERIVL